MLLLTIDRGGVDLDLMRILVSHAQDKDIIPSLGYVVSKLTACRCAPGLLGALV